MKALEDKIQEILSEHYDTDIIPCYSPNDSGDQFPKDIAKEVKEIAIAFAKYKLTEIARLAGWNMTTKETDEELWEQFIKERYK